MQAFELKQAEKITIWTTHEERRTATAALAELSLGVAIGGTNE
jgi:hypothetical protein